ncbi:MAG: ATP-grasp domain-containing protein [Clostridiales bacterium]|nr:ATP-grasp domain-containing protein [Clostridiales bacterium]
MMNFLFISPNYPGNYWQFCRALKQQGLRVLGIGDAPKESLEGQLLEALDDYQQVGAIDDYDQMYAAVARYVDTYGAIDWLESNNEYWLEQDARLRTAFHIESGFQMGEMPAIRSKSLMKPVYQQAGIPVARYHVVDDFKQCAAFAAQVGYPVVVKPDDGHGITDACKLMNDAELEAFLQRWNRDIPYLMEEFVRGEVNSYDAVIDDNSEPVFETGIVTPMSIIDIIHNNDNAIYYVVDRLSEDVRQAGRAAVKCFGVKSRFVHFEFFRLTQNHPGLGEAGQVVALEAGMCPCGGYALDMMNYAGSVDVYRIWAEMIAGKKLQPIDCEGDFCAFVGRKGGRRFLVSHDRLAAKYGPKLRLMEQSEGGEAAARYIGQFSTREEMDAFYTEALWCE